MYGGVERGVTKRAIFMKSERQWETTALNTIETMNPEVGYRKKGSWTGRLVRRWQSDKQLGNGLTNRERPHGNKSLMKSSKCAPVIFRLPGCYSGFGGIRQGRGGLGTLELELEQKMDGISLLNPIALLPAHGGRSRVFTV